MSVFQFFIITEHLINPTVLIKIHFVTELIVLFVLESDEVSPYAEGTSKANSVFGIYDENGVFRKVVLPVTNSKSPRDRSLSFSYGDYE